MFHAADLVLNRVQHLLSVLWIDDILEAVLMLVALFEDQPALQQLLIRPREVRHIDLHMMTVVRRQRLVGLAKNQVLPDPDSDPCIASTVILDDLRRRAHDLLIEAPDTIGGLGRHVKFHVADAECNRAKALAVGLITSDAVAPRTGRLDILVVLLKVEARAVEKFAHFAQALHQRLPIRNHDANAPAHYLRFPAGKMELAAPDVDPHIDGAGHQEWIARQPKPGDVENRRDLLIGHGHIDVFEGDYIAEVFGGTVECAFHKCLQSGQFRRVSYSSRASGVAAKPAWSSFIGWPVISG